jgi:hypothetical protein
VVIQETFDLIEVLPINSESKALFLQELNQIKPTKQGVQQLSSLFSIEAPNG